MVGFCGGEDGVAGTETETETETETASISISAGGCTAASLTSCDGDAALSSWRLASFVGRTSSGAVGVGVGVDVDLDVDVDVDVDVGVGVAACGCIFSSVGFILTSSCFSSMSVVGAVHVSEMQLEVSMV